jgi:hypothetical protein
MSEPWYRRQEELQMPEETVDSAVLPSARTFAIIKLIKNVFPVRPNP